MTQSILESGMEIVKDRCLDGMASGSTFPHVFKCCFFFFFCI